MKSRSSLHTKYYLRFLIPIIFLAAATLPSYGQMSSPRLRLAQNLLRNDEYQEALNIFKELAQTEPRNIFVIRGMQECFRELQQFDQLITLLTQTIEQYPGDLNWPVDLAEAYYLNDDAQKAKEIWHNVIKSQPKNIAVYRKVAGSMISERLFDQAIEVYELAQSNIPGLDNLNLDIANLYKLQLAYGKATRHLLRFFATNPNQKAYVQTQILSMTDESEKVPEILEAVEQFSHSFPDDKNILEIKAGIYIKLGRYDLALDNYRQLEDEKSNGAYLVRFALAARDNGAFKEALKAYQIVLRMHPNIQNRAQIFYDMANCYRNYALTDSAASLNRAISLYDSLASGNPPLPVKLSSIENLGDIYNRKYSDLDRSRSYYEEFLKLSPRTPNRDRVTVKLGDIFRAKNNLDAAENFYKQVTTGAYADIAEYKQAELVYFRGKFSEAESGFNKLMSRIGMNHDLTNDILTYLSDISEFKTDSLALTQFARAQLLDVQDRKSESSEIFSKLVYDKSALKFRALTAGIINYLDLGRFDEAIRLLTFFRETWPDDLNMDTVCFLEALTTEKMNKPEKALELYQSVLVNYPNSLHIDEARNRARRLDQMIKKEQS